jgi:hypothetical protein
VAAASMHERFHVSRPRGRQPVCACPAKRQPLSAAVLSQVRAEERSAAKAALSQAICRTKQQLGAKYGQEVGTADAEPQSELE